MTTPDPKAVEAAIDPAILREGIAWMEGQVRQWRTHSPTATKIGEALLAAARAFVAKGTEPVAFAIGSPDGRAIYGVYRYEVEAADWVRYWNNPDQWPIALHPLYAHPAAPAQPSGGALADEFETLVSSAKHCATYGARWLLDNKVAILAALRSQGDAAPPREAVGVRIGKDGVWLTLYARNGMKFGFQPANVPTGQLSKNAVAAWCEDRMKDADAALASRREPPTAD